MPLNEWQLYVNDPRTICKYGANCYQTNSDHIKTYKHPPSNVKPKKNTREKLRFSPYTKKDEIQTQDIKKDVIKEDSVNSPSQEEGTSTTTTDDLRDFEVKIPRELKYYDKNNLSLFKDLFLVDMPEDFFKFHELFLDNGLSIEKTLGAVNLELNGPYDLLLAKLPIIEDKSIYLAHWRYYYDPPEFQTVIKKKGKSEFHMGYFRDSPNEKPVFVASNNSEKDCKITPVADNIFAAVYIFLQEEKKSSPFVAMACQSLMDKIKTAAEKNKFSLKEYNIKKRHSLSVAKTLHGAGIVVPYNKKTQSGYRHLTETDAKLKTIFTKLKKATEKAEKDKLLSELQPVITYANIAVDECDFGTGLEAGIALFCSGIKDLESSALSCLTSAYNLLNRETFSKIIEIHLKYRRKGSKLSVIDF